MVICIEFVFKFGYDGIIIEKKKKNKNKEVSDNMKFANLNFFFGF